MPSKIRLFHSLRACRNESRYENVLIITEWAQCKGEIDASGNIVLSLTQNAPKQSRLRSDALKQAF